MNLKRSNIRLISQRCFVKYNKYTDYYIVAVLSSWKSSRLELFYEKVVLGNFAKFTGKHLVKSLFVNRVTGC